MNPLSTPQIAPDVIMELMDDKAVILSPRAGKVVVLNEVGTLIWQLLAAGKSLPHVEAHLVNQFGLPVAEVQADLEAFLAALRARGLLLESESP